MCPPQGRLDPDAGGVLAPRAHPALPGLGWMAEVQISPGGGGPSFLSMWGSVSPPPAGPSPLWAPLGGGAALQQGGPHGCCSRASRPGVGGRWVALSRAGGVGAGGAPSQGMPSGGVPGGVGRGSPGSVWPVGIFGPLELHLEALHPNLEAVHGLDGRLGTGRVVKAHEACGDSGDIRHGDRGDHNPPLPLSHGPGGALPWGKVTPQHLAGASTCPGHVVPIPRSQWPWPWCPQALTMVSPSRVPRRRWPYRSTCSGSWRGPRRPWQR